METSLVTFEEQNGITVLRFKPRESLYAADSRAMIEMWDAFEKTHLGEHKAVVFHMPKDFLSPKLVDDFWQRASQAPSDHAPIGGRARPSMLAAADVSVQRSLNFLVSVPVLTIGAVEGDVDFDLMGLLLGCDYRICSSDTTFINRTLERNCEPGTGTAWFLSRSIGREKTKKLYVEHDKVTAETALELGIVDRISEADSIEADAVEIANKFQKYDKSAIKSMLRAIDLSNLDLATYLSQVGTGFVNMPPSH